MRVKLSVVVELLLLAAILAALMFSNQPLQEYLPLDQVMKINVPTSTRGIFLQSRYLIQQVVIGGSNITNCSTTYLGCGNWVTPSNPLTLGNATRCEQLSFYLNTAPLGANPACVATYGGETYSSVGTSFGAPAGVVVTNNGVMSFQGMGTTQRAALLNSVTLMAGSNFIVNFPAALGATARQNLNYELLRTLSPCPSFSGVNAVINNCPNVTEVGACNCSFNSSAYNSGCLVSVTVAGPLQATSNSWAILVMNQDCATFNSLSFRQTIAQYTGIPALSLTNPLVVCSSVTASFQCMALTTALAQANCQTIVNSATSGPLKGALGVTQAYLSPTAFTGGYNNTTTTTTRSTPTQAATSYTAPQSSGNPALWALMALLIIPIGIGIGLLVWCCMKKKDEPMPPPEEYKDGYRDGTAGEAGREGGEQLGEPMYSREPSPMYTPAPSPAQATGGTIAC